MSAQLQQAIINAHNAGDVAAAQRLGQMLKKERQASQVAPQAASPSGVAPHRRNQPKPPTDNAFEYGIDQAQSLGGGLIEGIGKKVNSPSMQKYGQDVQKQQEKDMAEGGYQFEYDSFRDAYEKNGLSGAISHGGSSVAAGIPTTGATLIGGGATALAATYGAPAWAIATLGAATTATGVGLGIGESVLEQKEKTGNFNADLAIGVGVVSGALDRLGVRKLFNLKQLKEMSADQIAEVLRKKGKGQKAKEFLKGLGIEGGTETAQEATQMASTAAVGGQYEGQEVQDRLTDAFITGGLMSATIKTGTGTVQAATNLVRGNSKSIKNEGDVEAAASFAQRMANIANANGYDLKDIDKMSTKGARETVDKAHVQYTEELKQKFADLKSRVKVTDQDSLAEVEDKIMTAAAYREGRNKTKNTVGNQEMAALERLTGDTREGQEAMSILRQLNQLTQVHNDGYQGGVSQVTDQFAPFGASVGYDKGAVATERLLRPLASGSAAISTGGGSLLAQAAAQGTGRLIDKVTGKRSKVANYIKENSGNQGIPGSNAASLRETNIAAQEAVAAQEEEARLRQEQIAQEEREASLESAQNNDPANPESPQGIFELGTALDRSGIAQILRVMKRNPSTKPATLRMIEAYETSVATGGQVDFALIRKINGFVDRNSVYKGLMGNRVRNQGVVQQAAQQQLSQKEQNYERGRKDNLAEAARIIEAVNADTTIFVKDKAILLNTLEEMQSDLGLNPVSRLQSMQKRLEEQDVPSPTVEKYLGQYLQRVMAQQGAKAERDAAQDDAMEIDESREPSFTSSPELDLGDMGSNPMRVSPSYPQGAKTTLDALAQNLQIGLGAVKNDPVVMQKIATKLRTYTPVTGDQAKNDSDFLEQAIEFYKGNLLALFDSVSPEYRDRAKLWYVGANKLAQEAALNYELPVEAVSGVYASLSPQQDWYVNYDIGMRTIDIFVNHQDTVFDDGIYNDFTTWVHGKYPSGKNKGKFIRPEKARKEMQIDADLMKNKSFKDLSTVQQGFFVRFWDQANNVERGHRVVTPEGGFADFARKQNGEKTTKKWNSFGPIVKSLEILKNPSRENINVQLGDMHKVRSFYNNILDPLAAEGDVTIDTHAIAAALLRPLAGSHIEVLDNFGAAGNSKNFGVFGSYGVFAEAYRRAASEVGVQPREMQSITWEAVRGLFPKTAKGAKQQAAIKSIWKQYENGTISAVEARKKVYEESGNIRAAQWENDRPNFESPTVERSSGNAGNVPSLRSSRGDGRGDRSNATGGVPQSPQEIDLSAAPGSGALTQPESPQIPFDFTTPTVGQIKDKLEDAKDAVQMVIGKPGTKFEKGLSSYEDYKQLADLLDVSIGVYDSQKDFMRDFPVGEATLGVFGVAKGGVSGQVGLIKGNKEQDFIQTLAHEVSHALESRPQSNQESPLVQGRKLSQRHEQAAADKKSSVYLGSLRSKMRKEIFNETPVKDEIEVLQDGTVVSIAARPDLPGRPIRLNVDSSIETYSAANPDATVAQIFSDVVPQFRQYQSYIKGDAEFAVDPVMYYLINPKAMKKDMPNTFKFIQKHFNESNIPIKLYASPLATIVAILMAGMIGGEEEEENPGILTPGPGMLSA